MNDSAYFYDPEEQVYIIESDGKEYVTKDKRNYEPRTLKITHRIFEFYVYGAIRRLMGEQYIRNHLDWGVDEGAFLLRLWDAERTKSVRFRVSFQQDRRAIIIKSTSPVLQEEYIIDPMKPENYDEFLYFWHVLIIDSGIERCDEEFDEIDMDYE